jgi:signal recognition particle GTPase
MLTPARTKALEYTELNQTVADRNERRELQRIENSIRAMADNEQDNHQKLVTPGNLRPARGSGTRRNNEDR